MSSPDTEHAAKSFAEVLAEKGRPVTEEGVRRAGIRRREAAAKRDDNARNALLERLRTGAA